MDKAISFSEDKPLVVEEPKEKEMKLVDASEFEGKVADDVVPSDLEEIYALAQEMVKFAHARGGIGLTLPQIGINKKAFVMLDKEDQWIVVINPEYFGTGKKSVVYERSLSYKEVYKLQRYKKINTAYFTIDTKNDQLIMKKNYRMLSGLRSFVFQNFVDILNGETGRTKGEKLSWKEEYLAGLKKEDE